MLTKLYGPVNTFLGTAMLPDTKEWPKIIKLAPNRYFVHISNDRYEEVETIPTVILQ